MRKRISKFSKLPPDLIAEKDLRWCNRSKVYLLKIINVAFSGNHSFWICNYCTKFILA